MRGLTLLQIEKVTMVNTMYNKKYPIPLSNLFIFDVDYLDQEIILSGIHYSTYVNAVD